MSARPPVKSLDEPFDDSGADEAIARLERNKQRADEVVKQALALKAAGFDVIPVKTDSKDPWHKRWDAAIQNDPRVFLLNPGTRNYGILPPPGCFILDVDKDVPALLARLCADLGLALPDTRVHQSPHGQHWVYRWPDGVPRPTGALWGRVVARWSFHDVVDGIKGKGKGYVVGPGSVVDGVEYRVLSDGEVADFPLALAESAARWRGGKAGAGNGASLFEGREPFVIPMNVPTGTRYEAVARYTGHLYNKDLSPTQMWAIIRDWAPKAFIEPKDEATLRKDFDRATKDLPARFGRPAALASQRLPEGEASGDGEMLVPMSDAEDAFPAGGDPLMFDSVLGDVVRDILPYTSADPVALLGALLAFVGPLVTTETYHFSRHRCGLNVCLVGETTRGAKGTAIHAAKDALLSMAMLSGWMEAHWKSGLGSGEALVTTTANAAAKLSDDIPRLTFVEEELDKVFAIGGRQGSSLMQTAMLAFDGAPLFRIRAKGEDSVFDYVVSTLGATTPLRLRDTLPVREHFTGGANRWLWLPVRRREGISSGGKPVVSDDVGKRVMAGLVWAKGYASIGLGPAAMEAWAAYSAMTDGIPDLRKRALSARHPAIALRIALLYAVLEQSPVIETRHLAAATALTDYARSGVGWMFGRTTGNAEADLVLRWLLDDEALQPDGSRRLPVRFFVRGFGPLRQATPRMAALDLLKQLGLVRVEKVTTEGRRREEVVLVVR